MVGKVLFGALAVVALALAARLNFEPAALGQMCVLWAICWVGYKGTLRSTVWVALGIVAFVVGVMWMPIVPLIVLYLGERFTRPKVSAPRRGTRPSASPSPRPK